MRVVTVASHNEGYFDALKESCKKNNLVLKVLGFGEKWKGFSWKFLMMRNYLETLPDDEIVVFVDAYDVIATQSATILEKRFRQFQKPIVFSVEHYTNVLMEYSKQKIFGKCRDQNLNSGMYMGCVDALKQMFSLVCSHYDCDSEQFSSLDDQRILTALCREKSDFFDKYMAMDENCHIFYNLYKIPLDDPEHEIRGRQLYLKKNDVSPCFIHGYGDSDLNAYLELYGLPSKKKARPLYLCKAVRHFVQFFYRELFILMLIIVLIFSLRSFQHRTNKRLRTGS